MGDNVRRSPFGGGVQLLVKSLARSQNRREQALEELQDGGQRSAFGARRSPFGGGGSLLVKSLARCQKRGEQALEEFRSFRMEDNGRRLG